jgi:predicted ATP-grasp superfamily ATP-dependent carboligase
MILGFTLQKIRQNPIRFGVGSVVKSIQYDKLFEIGKKLFKSIYYKGVGSAEFKLDERDGKLKLIEINARYWQQNSLPDFCGMNFPLTDYLEMTDQKPESTFIFTPDIKWVNIYTDFDSFLKYRKLKKLTLKQWIKSLKGKKTKSKSNSFENQLRNFILQTPPNFSVSLQKHLLIPRLLIYNDATIIFINGVCILMFIQYLIDVESCD